MEDYSSFPPYTYFTRVLKNCPKSSVLYVMLYKKMRKEGNPFFVRRKDVLKNFLVSPTIFRGLIINLINLNLIKADLSSSEYMITIQGIADAT